MPQFTFTNRLMEKALRRAFLDGVMEIYESSNQPRVYSITLEGTLSLLINKTEKYYIKLQETAERAKQADPRLIPKLPHLTAQKVAGTNNLSLKDKTIVNVKSEPDDKDADKSLTDVNPTIISTTKTPIMTFPPKLLQRILPKPTTTTVTVVSPKMSATDTNNSVSYTMYNDDRDFSLDKVKKEGENSILTNSSTSKVKIEPVDALAVSSTNYIDDDVMVVQPEWIEEESETGIKRDRDEDDDDDEAESSRNALDSVRKRIKTTLKNPIMAINLPSGGSTSYNSKDVVYFHKNIVECPLCKEPISNQSFLLLHLERHRKDLSDECEACNKGGHHSLDILLMHMTNFHIPGGAKETDLDKIKAPSLHMTTSAGTERLNPSKMVKLMLDRESAKATTVIKQETTEESEAEFEIEYVCDICGDSFNTSKDLSVHSQTEHGDNTGPFQCPSCDLNFDNMYKFQDHMLEHHKEEEKCKCQNCGIEFGKWKELKQHLMTAHRKFYTCPHCKVSFGNQESLKEHVAIHVNEKPDFFECDMCDKTFISSKTYNAHRRSHIDVKPYVCPICQSAFFKRGDMAKHMRTIHEPTKLYMCKICGRTGTRADNMRVHVRTHKKEISREQVDQLLQKVDQ